VAGEIPVLSLLTPLGGAHAPRTSRPGGHGVLELSVSECREASADRRPYSTVIHLYHYTTPLLLQ